MREKRRALSVEEARRTGESAVLEETLSVLEDAKARDIRIHDLRGRSPLADWAVIATAEASRHIDALGAQLRMRMKSMPRHSREGNGETGWLLFDAGNVIVHLFDEEHRAYYELDELLEAGAANADMPPSR